MTIYGKVIILKSLIVPQLIYLLTNLPNPNTKYFEEIEDIIIKFLWDGKKNKIKNKILYQEYSSAGINLPNIYIYTARRAR